MLQFFNQLFLLTLLSLPAQTALSGSLPGRASPSQTGATYPKASALVVKATTAPKYQLTDLAVLEDAFANQTSGVQVLVSGKVVRVLADDTDGGRHQRFIIALANSQTLLVAHNIDIAPRIENLQAGDQLYIYGEYEWNSQGGVIHWTHHDPDGSHVGGWIEKNGAVYQ